MTDNHSGEEQSMASPHGEPFFVSVIIPTRNGEGRIEHCLQSLAEQDYPKNRFEVIVADGLSTDRTAEIASEYGAHVVVNHGRTSPTGRNLAVSKAKGVFLAVLDDDCIVPPNWITVGSGYLSDRSISGVGGPTPIPESSSDFSLAVLQVFELASLSGYSCQSTNKTCYEADDIPGGNAMYVLEDLKAAGPFNEELWSGQDSEMHIRMRRMGMRLLYASDFFAWHHKKDSPKRFYYQMRRFAIGRYKINRIHKGSMGVLHWLTAFVAPSALAVLVVSLMVGKAMMIGAVAGLASFGLFVYTYSSARSVIAAVMTIPAAIIFFTGWSVGFFTEMFFPLKDATVEAVHTKW